MTMAKLADMGGPAEGSCRVRQGETERPFAVPNEFEIKKEKDKKGCKR